MRGIAVILGLITVCVFSVAIYRAEMSRKTEVSPTPDSRASEPESGIVDSGAIGQSDDRTNRQAPRALGNAETIRPGQPWNIDELLALNASGDELFSGNAELAQVQRTYSTAQKIFVFPDGETITLTYDASPNVSTEWFEYLEDLEQLDDGVSADFFDPLSEAARNGNADAATMLHQQLKYCTTRASTREQLDERIQALRNAVVVDGPSVEDRIAEEEQGYRRCAGTNAEMMDESLELLRLEADAGDQMSALIYANEIMNSDPESAELYFRQVWETGGTHGLFGLSRIFSDRAHASYEDAVNAHAYNFAWLAARIALYDGLPEDLFKYERERLLIEWKELQASGSYPVVLDSINRAHEIIASNPRCCSRM